MNAGSSERLRNHCGKGNDPVRVVVGNAAPVPGDDGLGRGQADAIAPGGPGAGGIRPVEAVKVPGELGRIHPRAGIGDGNTDVPPPRGYGQPDGSLRVAVFDRVVQQDGKQPEKIIRDAF